MWQHQLHEMTKNENLPLHVRTSIKHTLEELLGHRLKGNPDVTVQDVFRLGLDAGLHMDFTACLEVLSHIKTLKRQPHTLKPQNVVQAVKKLKHGQVSLCTGLPHEDRMLLEVGFANTLNVIEEIHAFAFTQSAVVTSRRAEEVRLHLKWHEPHEVKYEILRHVLGLPVQETTSHHA